MKKLNKAQQIRNYMEKHPTASTAKICSALGVEPPYVYAVRNKMKTAAIKETINTHINTHGDSLSAIHKISLLKEFAERAYEAGVKQEEPVDNVNHPPHYKTGGMETIDFIEAKALDYNLGNVVKYITRAKHKGNEVEDLKKAQWYLERAIMKLHI